MILLSSRRDFIMFMCLVFCFSLSLLPHFPASKATERKAKTPSAPKNTEATEKRNKRMVVLREWWDTEAVSGQGYTSSDVKAAMPEDLSYKF